jgi:hypothetical protein
MAVPTLQASDSQIYAQQTHRAAVPPLCLISQLLVSVRLQAVSSAGMIDTGRFTKLCANSWASKKVGRGFKGQFAILLKLKTNLLDMDLGCPVV